MQELNSAASLPKAKPGLTAQSSLVQRSSCRLSSKHFRTLETQTSMAALPDKHQQEEMPRRSGSMRQVPDAPSLSRSQSSKHFRTLETQTSLVGLPDRQLGGDLPCRSGSMVPEAPGLSRSQLSKQSRTLQTQTSQAELPDAQPGADMPRRTPSMGLASDVFKLPALPESEAAESEGAAPESLHSAEEDLVYPERSLSSQEQLQEADASGSTPNPSKLSRPASQQEEMTPTLSDHPGDACYDAAESDHGGDQEVPKELQQQAAPEFEFEDQLQDSSSQSLRSGELDADSCTSAPAHQAEAMSQPAAISEALAEYSHEGPVPQAQAADDQVQSICCCAHILRRLFAKDPIEFILADS